MQKADYDMLMRYATARNRDVDHEPRKVQLSDDLMLEVLQSVDQRAVYEREDNAGLHQES